MKTINIEFKQIHARAVIPEYKHDGDAGFDFYSIEDVVLKPHETILVKTGLQLANLCKGYEIQIRPRSGLALKQGLTILNSPGTVDSSYRGEICVLLHNSTVDVKNVPRGTRIAQGVLSKVEHATFKIVNEINETERGKGGFGSTGLL